MRFIISLILNALALWVVTLVYHGVSYDPGNYGALIVASLVLGLVNALVRPILLLLSLPIVILTLGLFIFVINGLTLWLVGHLVPGFHVDGLWGGIIGAILLGIVSWIISAIGLDPAKAAE
jgi:putative membrane protein